MISQNLILFLTNRGWNEFSKGEKFSKLSPPKELGLPIDYYISIPVDHKTVDFDRFFEKTLNVVSQIYERKIDDLLQVVRDEKTIFSIRVVDEETEKGSIPFSKFEDLIQKLKNIIIDTATFTLHTTISLVKPPAEAHKYLNLCKFLQTETGSFVAKIELPSKEILVPKNLFQENPVISEDVTTKMQNILLFINDIFNDKTPYISDDFLIENKELLNLEIFKEVESLFSKTEFKTIGFNFLSIKKTHTIESKDIGSKEINSLRELTKKIKDKLSEIKPVVFEGRITALNSDNPDSEKNVVKVVGLYEKLPSTATIKRLHSEEYKLAIDYHKMKTVVRIEGDAIINHNKINFISLKSFGVK